MKITFMRVLSVILSLLMIAAVVSCASAEGKSGDTTDAETAGETAAVAENTDSLEARKNVSDGLPTMNYDGETFTILYQDYGFDAGVEAISGDSLEDAMYNRNQSVSERFNVTFELINGGVYDNTSGMVKKAVNSGDYAYSLVMNHVIQTGSDIINGYYYDMANLEYINTDQPWYPQYAADKCEVNGKLYAIVSDAALTSVENTYCIYFNKNLAEQYMTDAPELYSLVNNGGWTIDKLSEYTALVYSDVNGSGKKDADDIYGNNTLLFYSFNFLWAFDQPIVSTENDEINLVLNCEKTVNILNRLYDYYYNNEGVYLGEYMPSRYAFENGNSLFLVCHFFPALEELREMEDEYGILPYPKWDEEQEAYLTNIDGSFNVLVCPVSVPEDKLEMTGIIIEALSAESWKTVMPVFYDITLKVKGTRDEESVGMIDIILDGRAVDFSWLYTGFNGYNFVISDLLASKKSGGDFSSYYQSTEKAKTRIYEKAFEYFYSEG